VYELLRLVRIKLHTFELLALLPVLVARATTAPRRPRWAVDLAGGRCAFLRAAGGLHGAGDAAGHQRQRRPGGA
jgi:hypothetical protein